MARRSKLDILVTADTRRATSQITRLGSALGGLSGARLGIGAAAGGIALVAAALANITMAGMSYGQEMQRAGRFTELTTKQIAGLGLAADKSDSNIDQVTQGVATFEKRMREATEGSKGAVKLFQDLGIGDVISDTRKALNTENLVSLPPKIKIDFETTGFETLLEVADAIKGLKKTEQIDLVKKAFGNTNLLPLLLKGSGFIRDSVTRGEGFGLDQPELPGQIEQITSNLADFSKQIQGIKLDIFASFADDIVMITTALSNVDFREAAKFIVDTLGAKNRPAIGETQARSAASFGLFKAASNFGRGPDIAAAALGAMVDRFERGVERIVESIVAKEL